MPDQSSVVPQTLKVSQSVNVIKILHCWKIFTKLYLRVNFFSNKINLIILHTIMFAHYYWFLSLLN